jgi:predicted ArsR family transcriptional regulator
VSSKIHETRQKIIEYLKEKEQATVDELAAVVSLTPMAVRYHLNVLQSENLISATDVRRPAAGRGRPQQVYQLTEAADDLFPVDYLSLTDYLLDELMVEVGQQGISNMFRRIAERLAREAPPPRPEQSIEERLDEVIDFLTEKGFVVDWERINGEYKIHAYSCPYRQLAKTYEHVCLLDKQIITTMLNTSPARIACLSDGDSHCTYQVSTPIQLFEPA